MREWEQKPAKARGTTHLAKLEHVAVVERAPQRLGQLAVRGRIQQLRAHPRGVVAVHQLRDQQAVGSRALALRAELRPERRVDL
jgi:hypothetical protein